MRRTLAISALALAVFTLGGIPAHAAIVGPEHHTATPGDGPLGLDDLDDLLDPLD